MTDAATITGGWRELLGARYLRTSILLAGGVALYATNEFLTTSLLPNTIAEIGGSRLYAWVMWARDWAHAQTEPIRQRVRQLVWLLKPRRAGTFLRRLIRLRRRAYRRA